MIRRIDVSEAALLLPLIGVVQAVHAQAVPDVFRANPNPAEVLDYLKTMLAKDEVTALAADTDDGTVVGYLIFEIVDYPGNALVHPRRGGFLHQIAVLPQYQRRGIGTLLIEQMKASLRARGAREWATSYWDFNEASARLMQKAGLRPSHIKAEGPL